MLVYIGILPPMNFANEADGPYSLIMAPSRELAQQTEQEIFELGEFLNVRVVSLVGGQSIEEQAFALRKGCEVVVATPGRIKDCIESRYLVLNQCNYIVLDEADKYLFIIPFLFTCF